jgi:hypothetical protein
MLSVIHSIVLRVKLKYIVVNEDQHMNELPPTPPDELADPFWNRKRVGLAVLGIVLVVILILVVLLYAFGPTICCGVFSNIADIL